MTKLFFPKKLLKIGAFGVDVLENDPTVMLSLSYYSRGFISHNVETHYGIWKHIPIH